MFKRILVASDLTEQTRAAVTLARQLAVETGASIIALHVVAMPKLRPFAGPTFRTDLASYRSLIDRQLETAGTALRSQLEDANVNMRNAHVEVRVGVPASMIATIADELNVDLIIVGRGRGGRLGPVAEHTVRLVGRTVMVAPVPKKRRARRPLPASTRRTLRQLAA